MRDERGRFTSLKLSEDNPHLGVRTPSTKDKAAQRVASLATPFFGKLDVRIPTFNLDDIPQETYDKMEVHPMVGLASEIKTNVIVGQDFSLRHDDPRVEAYCDAVLRPHWHSLVRNYVRVAVNRGWAPFELVWGQGPVDLVYETEEQKQAKAAAFANLTANQAALSKAAAITGTTDKQPDKAIKADELDTGDDTASPDESIDVTDEGTRETVHGWRIDRAKPLQPRNVRGVLIDGVENFAGYRVISPMVDLEVEDGSCLHLSHNARWGNFFGEAELKRAYEPWYWGNLINALYVRYMSRLATPIPQVHFPVGIDASGTDNATIATDIATKLMGEDMPVLTLPELPDAAAPKWVIDFLQMQGSEAGGKTFLDALNYYNAQILRALLMPDSVATTQGLSANRSIGQVHLDAFFASCEGYIDELTSAIDKQLLPLITLYTFGPDVAPPRIEVAPLTDRKREALQELLQMAFRSGHLIPPEAIDWPAVLAEADIPVNQNAGGSVVENPTDPSTGTSSIDAAEALVREEYGELADLVQGLRLQLASHV